MPRIFLAWPGNESSLGHKEQESGIVIMMSELSKKMKFCKASFIYKITNYNSIGCIFWMFGLLAQWGTSTRGIEVAQKCSLSTEAKAEWFDDSILKSKLNHINQSSCAPLLTEHFVQPPSLASTYVIVMVFIPVTNWSVISCTFARILT